MLNDKLSQISFLSFSLNFWYSNKIFYTKDCTINYNISSVIDALNLEMSVKMSSNTSEY